MEKEEYIKIAKEKLKKNSLKLMIKQIDNYFLIKDNKYIKNKYKIGDSVFLKKGTLMHGTYKNIEGLREIVQNGLLSSWIINARTSKYPSSVGVWNLKKNYYLKDYINFYSGGIITAFSHQNNLSETKIISFNDMPKLRDYIVNNPFLTWKMEQTKEARFLPSLVQNIVQIGIIMNGNCKEAKLLLEGDILNPNYINDIDVKPFVNESYYKDFIIERQNKTDYFTDRESAILFGVPSNLIEGILVGKEYEKNNKILEEIKKMLPNCYICNLDGIVIM